MKTLEELDRLRKRMEAWENEVLWPAIKRTLGMKEKEEEEPGVESKRPLCITCRFYVADSAPTFSKCGRTIDPVAGGPKEFCDRERSGSDLYDRCGPTGKYWEPKESDGR